jgi:hypothetical protein
MKYIITLLSVICALLLSGCSLSVTAKLYPVKGSYSEQKPLPILRALVKDVQRNSGDVTLTLPDGELCIGSWSSLAPQQVTMTSISGRGQITSGIQTAYTTVYGTGFSVSNVPGVNRGTAYLVGDRGTTIEVEFFTGSGTASGNGVAIDSKGNTYKVIF